jgi:hypothetical protein
MSSKDGQYLLAIRWAWDRSHTEFATITLEDNGKERFERWIEDPSSDPEGFQGVLERAAAAIDCSVMGQATWIGVFRVVTSLGVSSLKDVQSMEEPCVISLELRPLCSFDKDNKPIKWYHPALVKMRSVMG